MSQPLPGMHYCKEHQGNHSHYAEQNCEVCKLKAEIVLLKKCLLQAQNAAIELTQQLDVVLPEARRYVWQMNGNGYFLEENMLPGFPGDKEVADVLIDERIKKEGFVWPKT